MNLQAKDWSAQIQKALSGTYLNKNGGNCLSIRYARTLTWPWLHVTLCSIARSLGHPLQRTCEHYQQLRQLRSLLSKITPRCNQLIHCAAMQAVNIQDVYACRGTHTLETEIALSHGLDALACVYLYIQTCVVHIASFGGIATFYTSCQRLYLTSI